ncbi:Carboxypeptidase D [Paramuricea clavata]|uniref:Carboxypeptidase D n=1 Tax=Paramuricea clavata TaxID=317549 RepID=A0A7D9L3E4_PARCT|nr:Carboxypeptidase D [Paramuricea clavata]
MATTLTEDKFKAMKLVDLKVYLQNRGISVNSHLKPGLVAIACAVKEMCLPLLNSVSEVEEKLNFDKQALGAYKSYENYRLFYDGYVDSLLTAYRQDAGVHVYMGKDKIVVVSVLDAFCVCLGGRDGACKHVAAAMYSHDALLNTKGEDSVTSKPCKWTRRPKPDTSACEVRDLSVNKRGLKDQNELLSKKKKTQEYTFSQFIDHDQRTMQDREPCSPEQLATLVTSMQSMKEKPAILPILTKHLIPFQGGSNVVKPVEVLEHGIMEQKVLQHLEMSTEANKDTFVANLNFTQEERNNVAAVTKRQWQCKQWYVHKRGFVTASKCKSVYTRQVSVEKHITDTSALVNSLTKRKLYAIRKIIEDPKTPLDWGLKYENSARKAYYNLQANKHHQLSLVSIIILTNNTTYHMTKGY